MPYIAETECIVEDISIGEILDVQLVEVRHFCIVLLYDLFPRHLVGIVIIPELWIVDEDSRKLSVLCNSFIASPNNRCKLFLVEVNL